jgi:hypothetical protein
VYVYTNVLTIVLLVRQFPQGVDSNINGLLTANNTGVKFFSKMPGEIKQIEGFKAFRHELKLFLLNHSFYSLQ